MSVLYINSTALTTSPTIFSLCVKTPEGWKNFRHGIFSTLGDYFSTFTVFNPPRDSNGTGLWPKRPLVLWTGQHRKRYFYTHSCKTNANAFQVRPADLSSRWLSTRTVGKNSAREAKRLQGDAVSVHDGSGLTSHRYGGHCDTTKTAPYAGF